MASRQQFLCHRVSVPSPGLFIWGYVADRIGRRIVFMATVLNFALATGVLALTPEHNWHFVVAFRFLAGFGAASSAGS